MKHALQIHSGWNWLPPLKSGFVVKGNKGNKRNPIMPMIDYNPQEEREFEVLPKGTEVKVQCLGVDEKEYQDKETGEQKTYTQLRLEIIQPTGIYNDIYYPIFPMKDSDATDDKKRARYHNRIGQMLRAFHAENASDWNDLIGKEAWADVDIREYDGAESNTIKGFKVPK